MGQDYRRIVYKKMKVYIDTINKIGEKTPYTHPDASEAELLGVMPYTGKTVWDAGMFYCPYVPLQFLTAKTNLPRREYTDFRKMYGKIAT
jgi:hypothetical protein